MITTVIFVICVSLSVFLSLSVAKQIPTPSVRGEVSEYKDMRAIGAKLKAESESGYPHPPSSAMRLSMTAKQRSSLVL